MNEAGARPEAQGRRPNPISPAGSVHRFAVDTLEGAAYLAKLVEKGRIGFSIPSLAWIRRSLQEYDIRVVELTAEIAVESTLLSGMHADPADQIIAATSRVTGMPLVTSDKRLRQLQGIETIW